MTYGLITKVVTYVGEIEASPILANDISNERAVPSNYSQVCHLLEKFLFFELSVFLDNLT